MDAKDEVMLAEENEIVEDESLVIRLSKPFTFEHKDYDKIDLSGLDELSGADLVAAEKLYKRGNGMNIEVMPELSIEYAFLLASKASHLPIEFFMALPPRVAVRVRGRIMGFLFGRE